MEGDLKGLEARSHAKSVDCMDCPVYLAPFCFKELLSDSFKSSQGRWKRFASYFNIRVACGKEGLVQFWVSEHPARDTNSIGRLLEFARRSNCEEDAEFRIQLENMIAVHRHPNHFCCESDPAACFQCCSRCFHRPPLPSPPPSSPLIRTTSSVEPDTTQITGNHVLRHSVNPDTPRQIRNNKSEPDTVVPSSDSPVVNCDNILHFIESTKTIFSTTFPYNQFRPQPHTWLEFVIVLFLVYQTTTSTFITICEDEGPYGVFKQDGSLDVMELIRRICLYFLRILVRVATPFTFYRQICRMAEGERRYQENENSGADHPTTRNTHRIKQSSPSQNHHRLLQEVTLWSSIVPHAVLFSLALLFLGVFLTAEDKLIGDTRELFRMQVPIIGVRVFQLGDCVAVFFMMMVMGILKDCYCLENHLAHCGEYNIIRERWVLIDIFCYVTSFLLFAFTILMFIFGNPLTPPPSCDLDADRFQFWSFWIIALTLLQFCGSAANRILKKCCVAGNIVLLIFILLLSFVLRVKKVSVPPGSTILLLYTTLAVTVFNLLLCLTLSHYRSKGCKSKRFYFSLLCLVILSVSVLATAIREITHFALHNKSTRYCDAFKNADFDFQMYF